MGKHHGGGGGGLSHTMERVFVVKLEHALFNQGISVMKSAFSGFGADMRLILTGTNAEIEKARAIHTAAAEKIGQAIDKAAVRYSLLEAKSAKLAAETTKLSASWADASQAMATYTGILDKNNLEIERLKTKEAELIAVFRGGERALVQYYEGTALAGQGVAKLSLEIQKEIVATTAQRRELVATTKALVDSGAAADIDAQAHVDLAAAEERESEAWLRNTRAVEANNAALARSKEEAGALTASKMAAAEGATAGGGLGAQAGAAGALALGGVGAGVAGLAALAAGATAVTLAVGKMSEATYKASSEILRQTQILGLDAATLQANAAKKQQDIKLTEKQRDAGTDLFQTLEQGAKIAGIAEQSLDTWLQRFSQALGKLSDTELKHFGISTRDMNGGLRQFIDYLSHASNEQANLAVQQILGAKSADRFREVIVGGTKAVDARTQSMKENGTVMDGQTLRANALADAVHTKLGQAFQGAKNQIASQMAPALMLFWGIAQQVMGGVIKLMVNVAMGAAKVAIFFVSMFDAILGRKFDVEKFLQGVTGQLQGLVDTAKPASDSMEKFKKGQTDAKQASLEHSAALDREKLALEKLKVSTKAQTEALDDQIEAIRNSPNAYQKQIDALNDQHGAFQKNIDAINDAANAEVDRQRAVLTGVEETLRLYDLEQQRDDELHQSKLANLQDELDRRNDVQEGRRRSGESLVNYEERLNQKNLKDQIKKEQETRALKKTNSEIQILQLRQVTEASVKAIETQKTHQIRALEEGRAATIRALEDEKKAEEDRRAVAIKSLTERKEALDENLRHQTEQVNLAEANYRSQMAATAAAGTQDMGDMAKNVAIDAATMQQAVDDAVRRIRNSGAEDWAAWGQNAGGWINWVWNNALIGAQWFQRGLSNAMGDISAGWDWMTTGLSNSWNWFTGGLGRAVSGIWGDVANGFKLVIDGVVWLLNEAIHYINSSFDNSGINAVAEKLGFGRVHIPDIPMPFAEGGIIDRPMIISAGENYNPEVVIPLTKPARAAQLMQQTGLAQMGGGGGGGGTTFNNNFTGPIATEMVGSMVADRMYAQARRKGLLIRSGT